MKDSVKKEKDVTDRNKWRQLVHTRPLWEGI